MRYYTYAFYDILLLSCFLIGCLFMRKSWTLGYKLLVFLAGLTVLVEAVVQCRFFLTGASTFWLYNLFLPVETGCLVYIFYSASIHRTIRQLMVGLLILLPIGMVVFYRLDSTFIMLNEPVSIFFLFLELMSSCFFLIDALLDISNARMTRRPLFWLSCGLLFYCSSYILMHAFISFMTFGKIPENYYVLNAFITNFCMYTGFIACFIILRRAKMQQSPGRSFV